MRVVSMVPSWTETLLRAGVNVVGRTRYCVHPPQKITNVPIVGGTKDISWDLVMDLKPDFVILDKEENPRDMADECPVPVLTTHVASLSSLQLELARLGEIFENPALLEMSIDCLDIIEASAPVWDNKRVPGMLDWVRTPTKSYSEVMYVIWKKPWMCVSRETYIGSVLEKLGAKVVEFPEGDHYPVIELEEYRDKFILFSSEPYPFHKKIAELRELGVEGAVVNGESYSWFGARSIDFLKAEVLKKN